jgi:hypothetical protein
MRIFAGLSSNGPLKVMFYCYCFQIWFVLLKEFELWSHGLWRRVVLAVITSTSGFVHLSNYGAVLKLKETNYCVPQHLVYHIISRIWPHRNFRAQYFDTIISTVLIACNSVTKLLKFLGSMFLRLFNNGVSVEEASWRRTTYVGVYVRGSRGSSGSIVSDYRLDDRGSIPDRDRGFFF